MIRNRLGLVAIILLVFATLACSVSSPPQATPIVQAVTATQTPAATQTGAATASPGEATSTPEFQPTAVVAAGGCSLNAAFVADVTIPDNTSISAGSAFVKTWRIKNSGTCDWGDGFQLIFASGEQMGGPPAVSFSPVAAGDTTDISVDLIAPSEPGSHKGLWRIRSQDGSVFDADLTVVIVVPEPPQIPTVTDTPISPTATPTVSVILPPGGVIIPPGGIKLPPQTSQVLEQISVTGGSVGHAVAGCPSDSVVTGGGYAANSNLYVYNSSRSGNGWQVYAKNASSSSQLLNAYAICLSNAGGSSTQVLKQVSASGGGIGNAIAACPAGSVVTGGGYAVDSDKSLFVYNSSRSGNGWQVYAKNMSGSSQLLNAYAICLSGTEGTISQVLNQVSAPGNGTGHAVATCANEGLVTGGGFAGNTNLAVYNTSMPSAGNGWETYARNISNSNQLLNSYAICIKFP